MSSENINLEFIERYQKLYQKDPRSKVFAPLGEAYRKMGLIKEAHNILKVGVKLHPHFVSGRVAYAKVLMDQKLFDEASNELLIATDLSSENLLAQKLLAECYVHIKKPKEALRAFKMVLFLNPNDAHAQMHVRKLESLTADEYEDDVFEMKPLKEDIKLKKSATPPPPMDNSLKGRQLERVLSLTDAFIVRMDFDRALETIESSENMMGTHPEFQKRKQFINSRVEEHQAFTEDAPKMPAPPVQGSPPQEQRIDFLKNLLHKIETRKT